MDSAAGISLSVALTSLLALLLVVNVLAGHTLLAAINLASVGLGAYVTVRWIRIRDQRRRLDLEL